MIRQDILEAIEIEPSQTAKYSVIWLHGLGADGQDFVPIVPELKLPEHLPVRFIFPHAPVIPVTINAGYQMRAWYDIVTLSSDEREVDNAGIAKSITEVNALIAREEARGIPSANIILAGFSQGAVMAINAGLAYPQPLAGIIALSGYLPSAQEAIQSASAANKKTPIFMAHGSEDTVVSPALGQAAYTALKDGGYQIDWHTYKMPHSVCMEEVQDISVWMQKVLG